MYEKFKELLLEKGIRAADVAKATGIAPQTFSAWKKGLSTPKQDKLKLIADYFGVSLDYLTGNQSRDKDIKDYKVLRLMELANRMDDDLLTRTIHYAEYLIYEQKQESERKAVV